MGYHRETMVCSFPPYPSGGTSLRSYPQPWSLARALYGLKPWIGFDVWHIDPEKPGPGNRTDNSCGWFPRDLTPPIQKAVDQLLGGGWEGERRMVENAMLRAGPYDARYSSIKRMPAGEGYAMALMMLTLIDRLSLRGRRYHWRRDSEWKAQLRVQRLAQRLTLNDTDSLLEIDEPERFIKLLAVAYRRDIRPWWKHPRWHVHHWKIHFDLGRNIKRMFEPCATCRRPLGFGYSPHADHRGSHHSECLGIRMAGTNMAAVRATHGSGK